MTPPPPSSPSHISYRDQDRGDRDRSAKKRTFDDTDSEEVTRRPTKTKTSPERWIEKQLIASGVLKVQEYPGFDEETGLLHQEEEEQEQAFEVERNEDEAPFLRGQVKTSLALSPVKIVKNPDGTLSRAAMTQSQLAKERRELREQQKAAKEGRTVSHNNYNMEDPMQQPTGQPQ